MKKFKASMYTPDVSYTYPGKITKEILDPATIETPSLNSLFTIRQGIRCGEYVHIMQPLSTILTKGTADCEPTYTQSGTITDRQIITAPFEVNLSYCKKEFIAICNGLSDSDLVPAGLSGYELGGTLRTKIFTNVLDAVRRDIFKVMFLGNNSLGSGSTSIYSAIDGVFTKFFDSAGSYCVEPIDNTLPNQHNSVLSTNQARDTLRLLWGNSSTLLKQSPAARKAIWVSGSVWENYYDSVVNDCCVEGSWKAGQDGLGDRLYYRGIELIPLWILDDTLENDSTNPYYDIIRHFAVYTAKDNHIMGVENASDLNNLELCYDCKTKTSLIQGEMRFGYQFALCDLISWAK